MDSDPFLIHETDTAIKWICHDQSNTLKNEIPVYKYTLHIHQTYCRTQIHNDISEK